MKLLITPKKSLGQNFLVNPRILDKIVAAAEITKDDLVLEVGPGTGNLTKKLAEKAGKVIAIEKDRRLITQLKETFKNNEGIKIIEGDILKINFNDLKIKEDYKIIGNIPYYITGKLFKVIFDPSSRTSPSSVHYGARKWPKPKLIVLTIQKEVAQRVVAKPPKMNLLALSVQFFTEPKIISYISKENFRPRPKVDSAIIKLIPKRQKPDIDTEKFFKVIRAGFSQKRKLLVGNLSKKSVIMKEEIVEIFTKLNIQPKARAENLSLNKWVNLAKYLGKFPI